MQRGKVLNLGFFNKFLQFVLKNKLLIFLSVVFVTGFSVAVFTYGKLDFLSEWSRRYIQNFTAARCDASFFGIAVNSFLTSLLFIAFCLVCGTSVLGLISVPVCVFAKAFIYGTVTAYLYSAHSLNGVAFHAVILLPPAIFFIIGFMLSSIEAINFSVVLAGLTVSKSSSVNLYYEFKRYCIRFLLFCIFVLLSALLDAMLSVNFLGNFKL